MKTKLLQLANLAERNVKRIALTAGASVAALPAMADGIDVTTITASINGLVVTVTSIGTAILAVYVVVKGFQMVKGALKGG